MVESFEVGGAVQVISKKVDDAFASCDNDGALDNGEVGTLTVLIRNTGTRSLATTRGTVTTSNPNVTFPGGNQITFPATRPFETATGSVYVRLIGARGIQTMDLKIMVSDPGLTPSIPVIETLVTHANYNVRRGSLTDDVEAPVSAWTPTLAFGSGLFERIVETASPLNHAWHGPDLGLRSDRALVSPELKVGTAPFRFSFDHRYLFDFVEFGGMSFFFDGGVIELSADDGATWRNIGAGYTGRIATGGGNPLEGKMAYVGLSPGYPGKVNQTINLGTAYANQTVRIRFRIGEDFIVGAPGWELDNFMFNGLTNAPFTRLVVDPGCVASPPLSSQNVARPPF
jgi:hypothetical protein